MKPSFVHRFVFQTCEHARQAVAEAQEVLEDRHLKDVLDETLIETITQSPEWLVASRKFTAFKNKLRDVLTPKIHLHRVDALVAELCTSA